MRGSWRRAVAGPSGDLPLSGGLPLISRRKSFGLVTMSRAPPAGPVRSTAALAVLLALLAAALPAATRITSAQAVSVSIAMPGEASSYVGQDQVLLAGIWHDITVETGKAQDDVTLEMFSGNTTPANGSESDQYRFQWSDKGFSDLSYGKWIDGPNSLASKGTYRFRLAISGSATLGTWTLLVNGSGTELVRTSFVVASPDVEFSISSPDFLFNVEPGVAGTYYPAGANYFRSINSGNMPLSISIEFTELGDWMRATNVSVLHPGTEHIHHLSIEAPSWTPGETRFSGDVVATPLHRGPGEVVGLDLSYSLAFTATVRVGRGGLAMHDEGAFVLQYPTSLSGEKDKDLQFDIYLSGKKPVVLSITLENASQGTVLLDGKETELPGNIDLTNGKEVRLNISIRPTRSGIPAKVLFTITTSDNTVQRTYITEVAVSGEIEPEVDDGGTATRNRTATVAFLVGAIAIASFVGILIFKKSERTREVEIKRKRNTRNKAPGKGKGRDAR